EEIVPGAHRFLGQGTRPIGCLYLRPQFALAPETLGHILDDADGADNVVTDGQRPDASALSDAPSVRAGHGNDITMESMRQHRRLAAERRVEVLAKPSALQIRKRTEDRPADHVTGGVPGV